MNDANYIIKNIAMLKRNSINVKNLTNKFCIELSRNYGINRTEELENTISEILTKYKQGEITDDIVVESFGVILNTPNSSNLDTNTSDSNSSTVSDEMVEKTQNVESSPKTEVEKKEEPIKEEIVQEEKKETASTPTEDNKKVPSGNSNSNVGGSTAKSSNSSEETVTDVNTDNLGEIINTCSGIEGGLEGANITVPALVAKYASEVLAAAGEIAGVTASLGIFKGIIGETIQAAIGSDVEYGNEDYSNLSWSELYERYDRSLNSKAVRADEEFFKNCEIQGNYAILYIDGRECKYDMKKHRFYVDGKLAFTADIMVPSNASDYSNLNTYTFFSGKGYMNHILNGKDGEGGKGQSTNSVLIQIQKQGVWTKFNETGLITKFVNQAANTNLEKCKNVVGGDSMYGTFALRTAANNKGLYDTVYCVNNAIISPDAGNNNGGDKQQMSGEEVTNLDGLDIYFISAAGDPNLDHGKRFHNFSKKGGPFNEAYTYTGIVYLLNKCPNANVHMVYSSNASSPHNAEMQIYKDLEQQFDNYEYIPDAWLDFANDNYQTHTCGNYIPAEASKSSVTNSKKQ